MNTGLWEHLWRTYAQTRDGRSHGGDVEILAEAAERMEWPGAPEMGREIAELLRRAYKPPEGEASKAYRATREKEIIALAEIHAEMGRSQAESAEIIAGIYGTLSPAAVVKILQRSRKDKHP